MKTSNFTKSECGIDIEVEVDHDHELGRSNFIESFISLPEKGSNSWLYVDYGNLSSDYDDSCNYEKVEIIGYCQGDYATIYVNSKECLEVFGNAISLADLRKECHNLFYDSPVFLLVTINGTDYMTFDLLYDNYSYDKTEVIASILKMRGEDKLLKSELNRLLPESID